MDHIHFLGTLICVSVFHQHTETEANSTSLEVEDLSIKLIWLLGRDSNPQLAFRHGTVTACCNTIMRPRNAKSGAGGGNRTLVPTLAMSFSTIEIHPHEEEITKFEKSFTCSTTELHRHVWCLWIGIAPTDLDLIMM